MSSASSESIVDLTQAPGHAVPGTLRSGAEPWVQYPLQLQTWRLLSRSRPITRRIAGPKSDALVQAAGSQEPYLHQRFLQVETFDTNTAGVDHCPNPRRCRHSLPSCCRVPPHNMWRCREEGGPRPTVDKRRCPRARKAGSSPSLRLLRNTL
ncbi:hypothetical protein VTK26DRAFT_8090 [Humicola hyalothermophila]